MLHLFIDTQVEAAIEGGDEEWCVLESVSCRALNEGDKGPDGGGRGRGARPRTICFKTWSDNGESSHDQPCTLYTGQGNQLTLEIPFSWKKAWFLQRRAHPFRTILLSGPNFHCASSYYFHMAIGFGVMCFDLIGFGVMCFDLIGYGVMCFNLIGYGVMWLVLIGFGVMWLVLIGFGVMWLVLIGFGIILLDLIG
ncbi:hypothetical protein AVEN_6853-1 [Araneus ventricosus]|uniref:Transmembrane protein n=1 Tax=Araneus ventricosus TaxID=182803 RepID=A0A4Y2GU92_ARAVE|nr:hypothetical protein AVEN_6853-1 [Araneus ventricosus]